MQKIRLVDAREKDKLKDILNKYLVEISKYDDVVKFDKNGLPVYQWFDCYFKDYGRFPIFFVVDEKIAGFALVRYLIKKSYEIAEFCVFEEYRGDGASQLFAKMICDFFDGQIEFSTNLKNKRAVKFWNKFTTSFSCVEEYEENGRKNWIINKKT